MKTATEATITNRIQDFVAELDKLVRRSALEAVAGVLGNGAAAPARRGPGRPAGKRGPGRPRGAGSAKVDEIAAAIPSYVASNDGQSVSQIAAGIGAPLPAAKKAIAQLLASGGIKKSGQRRGTRYHAGSGASSAAAGSGAKGKRGKRAGKKRGRKAKAA
jgi:hypothetical protein